MLHTNMGWEWCFIFPSFTKSSSYCHNREYVQLYLQVSYNLEMGDSFNTCILHKWEFNFVFISISFQQKWRPQLCTLTIDMLKYYQILNFEWYFFEWHVRELLNNFVQFFFQLHLNPDFAKPFDKAEHRLIGNEIKKGEYLSNLDQPSMINCQLLSHIQIYARPTLIN